MADKQTALSIVIRTVDQATAKIQAINARLGILTTPMKNFGKATAELREHLGLLGLDALKDGISGVGSAVSGIIGKVALVGGVVAAAVAGVMSMVDHFDALGDKAEQLGTSADFLAAFRFAAERAGAPLEGIDEALQTLVTNMGAAKAGTGRMLKGLMIISPVLARQVTAAHSLEEALGLLADAEAKLPDAARRAKLAALTLGDPKLAPLLARGSKGVQELLTQFHDLAGNMGEAAEAAGKTDDGLKNLHAATEGAKAALVTGLAPALTIIIAKMTTWLAGHRSDIETWSKDIGERLPAAVDKIVDAIKGAIGWVSSFVDGIGGWKVASAGLAVVIAGPLIASVVSLGVALLATPVGWILTGIAAITAAVVLLVKNFDKVIDAATAVGRALVKLNPFADNNLFDRFAKTSVINPGAPSRGRGFQIGGPPLSAESARQEAISSQARDNIEATRLADMMRNIMTGQPATKVEVAFTNAPKGTRATVDRRSPVMVDLSMGFQWP